MTVRAPLVLLALALFPLLAAAQSTATPAGAVRTGDESPASSVTAPDKAPDSIDRLCLRETGTLIRPRRAQAARERCPSHVFGRVWTQDDLRSTGQPDIAQALRMLDPSIR